jgi:hypothetical protein
MSDTNSDSQTNFGLPSASSYNSGALFITASDKADLRYQDSFFNSSFLGDNSMLTYPSAVSFSTLLTLSTIYYRHRNPFTLCPDSSNYAEEFQQYQSLVVVEGFKWLIQKLTAPIVYSSGLVEFGDGAILKSLYPGNIVPPLYVVSDRSLEDFRPGGKFERSGTRRGFRFSDRKNCKSHDIPTNSTQPDPNTVHKIPIHTNFVPLPTKPLNRTPVDLSLPPDQTFPDDENDPELYFTFVDRLMDEIESEHNGTVVQDAYIDFSNDFNMDQNGLDENGGLEIQCGRGGSLGKNMGENQPDGVNQTINLQHQAIYSYSQNCPNFTSSIDRALDMFPYDISSATLPFFRSFVFHLDSLPPSHKLRLFRHANLVFSCENETIIDSNGNHLDISSYNENSLNQTVSASLSSIPLIDIDTKKDDSAGNCNDDNEDDDDNDDDDDDDDDEASKQVKRTRLSGPLPNSKLNHQTFYLNLTDESLSATTTTTTATTSIDSSLLNTSTDGKPRRGRKSLQFHLANGTEPKWAHTKLKRLRAQAASAAALTNAQIEKEQMKLMLGPAYGLKVGNEAKVDSRVTFTANQIKESYNGDIVHSDYDLACSTQNPPMSTHDDKDGNNNIGLSSGSFEPNVKNKKHCGNTSNNPHNNSTTQVNHIQITQNQFEIMYGEDIQDQSHFQNLNSQNAQYFFGNQTQILLSQNNQNNNNIDNPIPSHSSLLTPNLLHPSGSIYFDHQPHQSYSGGSVGNAHTLQQPAQSSLDQSFSIESPYFQSQDQLKSQTTTNTSPMYNSSHHQPQHFGLFNPNSPQYNSNYQFAPFPTSPNYPPLGVYPPEAALFTNGQELGRNNLSNHEKNHFNHSPHFFPRFGSTEFDPFQVEKSDQDFNFNMNNNSGNNIHHKSEDGQNNNLIPRYDFQPSRSAISPFDYDTVPLPHNNNCQNGTESANNHHIDVPLLLGATLPFDWASPVAFSPLFEPL